MKKLFLGAIAAVLAACTASPQEQQAWDNARSAGTVEAYRAYLTQFPNGIYAGQAIGALETTLSPSEIADLGYARPSASTSAQTSAGY